VSAVLLRFKLLFLSFLLPCVVFGADHCTDPDKYTIDKRCYVTDEQKKQTPYNSVAALLRKPEYIYCTGTLVQWDKIPYKIPSYNDKFSSDDIVYMVTAKHCSDVDDDGNPDKILHIKLQNGSVFDVDFVVSGNYDLNTGTNSYNDWAMYKLPDVFINDGVEYVFADSNGKPDDRNISKLGYGTLKIMSDQDIQEFKEKYMLYLIKTADIVDVATKPSNYGFHNNGLVTKNNNVVKFIDNMPSNYWLNLFADHNLKMSKCKFNDNSGCHIWSADSGGPSFDNRNYLVGVHKTGFATIGGSYHARSGYMVPTGEIYEQMIQNMEQDKKQ
jgi:hypothetical protein